MIQKKIVPLYINSSIFRKVIICGKNFFYILGMFDKDKKGTIDFEGFQALFNYVNAWIGVFRGFDHDNSGTIQESELAAAFTQMGYRLSPDFVRYLMSIADSEGNRQDGISVDQFIVLCIQIQKFTGKKFYLLLI